MHIRYPKETACVMFMYPDIKQTDGQTEYSRAPESRAYLFIQQAVCALHIPFTSVYATTAFK